MSQNSAEASEELQSFKDAKLWDGGFMDCDPLNPLGWSSYTTNGFVSIYHALMWAAIKPYMPPGARVLEIGPGHGAWTRALLECGAETVVALDVQTREFNNIDAWVREHAHKLQYYVVEDMSCSMVADQSIDFMWSGGAFVHMSEDIQTAYITNMFKKMKSGAHGFIQYADMDIWNNVVTNENLMIHSVLSRAIGGNAGDTAKALLDDKEAIKSRAVVPEVVRTWNVVAPGRYYYVGRQFMGDAVAKAGFKVIDTAFLPSLRDPVVHFQKP